MCVYYITLFFESELKRQNKSPKFAKNIDIFYKIHL